MASSSSVLPLATDMPMFTFSARSASEANWKSPSVPAKLSTMRSESFAAAAVAVGRSVQTKSTAPVWSCMTMAGAVSAAVWIWASGIWGRQVSYQMVPDWAVQRPPARSAMPWAAA